MSVIAVSLLALACGEPMHQLLSPFWGTSQLS